MPRTGTSSLRLALSHVLKGPVYHMFQVFEGGQCETDFWSKVLRNEVHSKDWKEFFEGRGFRAGVDFPTAAYYR